MYIANNLGPIDANLPFQIFGPLPSKGCYLLFGSSEWLNKSITEITVQIFWEKNIPSDFATYYAAYPEGFNNTSFKVAFSILIDGVWELLNDEPFSLFELNKDNTISHLSTFNLKLIDKLILAKSEENNGQFEYNNLTRNGFIKMELIAPKGAFGHSHYPRLYTEAIMNATVGKFSSLPSIPYVPIVAEINFITT